MFGRRHARDPRTPGEGTGLARRWRSLRVGHRAMIALLGGTGLMVALSFAQAICPVVLRVWLNLLGVACAVAGILYAHTRHCPSCGAGGVVTIRGPQRNCDECGTQFLNDRFF
jgi:hypothetical protein